MKINLKKIKIRYIIIIGVIVFLMASAMNIFLGSSSSDEDLVGFIVKPLPKETLDCMTCHTGKDTFKAIDTINRNTCDNCHKSGTDFLIPISKDVHQFHQGDTSNLPKANYIERHKTDINISCDSCHIFVSDESSPNCKTCHKGNDHVSRTDKVCSSCHGYLSELFRHDSISLKTHDRFGDKSCSTMCHSGNRVSLRLFNDIPVAITDSSRLCKQCHSGIYNSWEKQGHYSTNSCVDCHDPHDPKPNVVTISKKINK